MNLLIVLSQREADPNFFPHHPPNHVRNPGTAYSQFFPKQSKICQRDGNCRTQPQGMAWGNYESQMGVDFPFNHPVGSSARQGETQETVT